MDRIVSYSYFRSSQSCYEKEKGNSALQFEQFLPLLVRGHHVVWKGWTCRIYHDLEVMNLPYWSKLARMHHEGLVELVNMGRARDLCEAMLWRWIPAIDPNVSGFLVCRDIDAIPQFGDRQMVEEFMASGKDLHVIHDNPSHSGIMGGTTAVYTPSVAKAHWGTFAQMVGPMDKQGDDQRYLNAAYGQSRSILVHGPSTPKPGLPNAEHRPVRRIQHFDDIPSKGIGVCDWPTAAMQWMEDHREQFPVISKIEAIERDNA